MKSIHILADKIDTYIRTNYKDDTRKKNSLICLFKTNIDKIESIEKIEDFEIKYNQSKGCEKELLEIINVCKKSTQK